MVTDAVDAVIVGGGPAGLSAALILGRAVRDVVVYDEGLQRNRVSHVSHGFLTRDGAAPSDLLDAAGAELQRYGTVQMRRTRVVEVERIESGFAVVDERGGRCESPFLLLTTGVRDVLPDIEGLAPLWGKAVFVCPYCDAWERRDQPLAVIGRGKKGAQLALMLSTWSDNVTLCANEDDSVSKVRDRLKGHGVDVRTEKIARLVGREAVLDRIEFEAGPPLYVRGVFVASELAPNSGFAQELGCEVGEEGLVIVDDAGATTVEGVYAAGDVARRRMQVMPSGQVIQAAGNGSLAAIAINVAILERQLGMSEVLRDL